MIPEFDLMSATEVADLWQVDERSARRWCAKGRLAGVKDRSGQWRIRVASVRGALVAGGTSAAEADARIAAVLGQAGS